MLSTAPNLGRAPCRVVESELAAKVASPLVVEERPGHHEIACWVTNRAAPEVDDRCESSVTHQQIRGGEVAVHPHRRSTPPLSERRFPHLERRADVDKPAQRREGGAGVGVVDVEMGTTKGAMGPSVWAGGGIGDVQRAQERCELPGELDRIGDAVGRRRRAVDPTVDRPWPPITVSGAAPSDRLRDRHRQRVTQNRQPRVLLVDLGNVAGGCRQPHQQAVAEPERSIVPAIDIDRSNRPVRQFRKLVGHQSLHKVCADDDPVHAMPV